MEEEIWVDSKKYFGYIQVSNIGNVRSVDRPIYRGNTIHCMNKGRVLATKNRMGYIYVGININGIHKNEQVHRLIADAFIPNPENKATVNHIDGNPSNNLVRNLEWCTYSENNTHSYRVLHKKPIWEKGVGNPKHPRNKGTVQLDLDGNVINIFFSSREASRITKINRTLICRCARGESNTAGGFRWEYAN